MCRRVVLFVVACLWIPFAAAQQSASRNPKVIEVITEGSGSPSKGGLRSLLNGLAQHSKEDAHWIATKMIAGELAQSMMIVFHDNYQDISKTNRVIRAEWERLPASSRPNLQSRVFEVREDVSYNSSHIPWGRATAYSLSLVKLRRGGTDEYTEQQKLAAQLLTAAHVQEEEWIGYQAQFGEGVPAFLFVTPMRSVADLDIDLSGVHGNLFTPEQDRKRSEVLREAVVGNTAYLVEVEPALSNPLPVMRAESPTFWGSR